MVASSRRVQVIAILVATLFFSLVVAHFTATASQQDRDRETRLCLDSLEAKTIKVGGVTISARDGYSGIWLTNPSTNGMVSMYIVEGQGPVIGVHRSRDMKDGYDLALTADKGGEPRVQYRKKDGTLGMLTVKELDSILQSRN